MFCYENPYVAGVRLIVTIHKHTHICDYYHIKYLYNLWLIFLVSIMARCTECGTEITIENLQQGERVECPGCGIDLEVTDNGLIGLQLGPSEE